MIPKTIHWIWLSDDPPGRVAERCIASWRRQMPDCAVRRWTLADFDLARMPRWVREAVAAKKWAFACDCLRLWVLAREGGWYFDSDVLLVRPLSEFSNRRFVSAVEYYPGTDFPPAIQAAAMGAEAGHPFLGSALSWYAREPFVLPDGSCNTSKLAPHVLADAARRFGFVWNDIRQELRDDLLLLPSRLFAPTAAESGDESYLVHLCSGSWRDLTDEQRMRVEYWNLRTIRSRTTALGRCLERIRRVVRR